MNPSKGAFVRGVWLVLAFVLAAVWVPTSVNAEVTGDVEAIGFDQNFRPGVWTPLVVRLRPGMGDSGTYQIQIEQEDLDRDLVTFTRTIALTAPVSGTGAGTDQRFTLYFLPQGTRNSDGIGLPDRFQNAKLDALENQLKVYLCNERGERLMKLPIRSMISSIEPVGDTVKRGMKLVLWVYEGMAGSAASIPSRRDLDTGGQRQLLGVMEDIFIVPITARSLPTSALGYQAVDAVVWAAGAPPNRNDPLGERHYSALREYLGAGGRLVIMQHPEWLRTAAWGELLPVTFPAMGDVQGTVLRNDLPVLVEMAMPFDSPVDRGMWNSLTGPHAYGVAKEKEGALVDYEVSWNRVGMPRRSPWLARQGVGAGCVTYVAQDLGSPLLSPNQPPPGWPRIWSKVLDYRYEPEVPRKELDNNTTETFAQSRAGYELGQVILSRMELTSRVGALIGISVLFFILYWLAAGPGSWVFLKIKDKADFSWLVFAGVALAATLVTILVVRLILRGSPEIRHFTLVRVMPGEPALVESRIGLYIPRDGNQRLALPVGSPDHATALAAYAIHPYHASRNDDQFPSFRRYQVAVREVAGDEPVAIDVPFRSTAKRIQAHWRGNLKGSFIGRAAINAPGISQSYLTGVLTNDSGRDLKNVFMVFRSDRLPNRNQDRFVFVPTWKNGEQLSLDEISNQRRSFGFLDPSKNDGSRYTFDTGVPIFGMLGLTRAETEFDRWLRATFRGSGMIPSDTPVDDAADRVPRSYLYLSLFDRFPFFRSTDGLPRSDMMRFNARFMDISAALSGGRMVILAQSDGSSLPIDFTVDDEKIDGTGTTFYQFILPLDRKNDLIPEETDAPATQSTGR